MIRDRMSFTFKMLGSIRKIFLRASFYCLEYLKSYRMTVSWIHINQRIPRSLVARILPAMLGITLIPVILNSQAAKIQKRSNELGIRWIEVEGGTFTMGVGNAAHQETVDRFMMSATEITFD